MRRRANITEVSTRPSPEMQQGAAHPYKLTIPAHFRSRSSKLARFPGVFHSFDIRMAGRQGSLPASRLVRAKIFVPAYRQARKFERPGMRCRARAPAGLASPRRPAEGRCGSWESSRIPHAVLDGASRISSRTRISNFSLQRKPYSTNFKNNISEDVDILAERWPTGSVRRARQEHLRSSSDARWRSPCRHPRPQI